MRHPVRPSFGFYVLSAVWFLEFLASGSTGPFHPLYAQSLGATLVNIAWIAGGYSTVSLVASLLWGRLSDRLRCRRPFLIASTAALGVCYLLMSAAPDWWVLLPLRLLEGAAFGAFSVAALAMMGDILEGHPHRARMIGLYRMSGSLAFSVAVVVGGFASEQFGLPTTFRTAGLIFLLAFLISLALPEPGPSVSVRERDTSLAELLRGPMLPLVVVAASFTVPVSAVYSVWPLWVAEGLGLGRATFSQLWGLAAFVEVPSMVLAGYLADRFGGRLTFTIGLTLFGGVYLMYFAFPVLPGLVAAQMVRGCAYAAFTATALTMAIEVAPPEARGRASGLFQMAQSLSQIVGSYAGGPMAQALGYPALFLAAAGTLFLGAGYVRVAVPGQPAEVRAGLSPGPSPRPGGERVSPFPRQ